MLRSSNVISLSPRPARCNSSLFVSVVGLVLVSQATELVLPDKNFAARLGAFRMETFLALLVSSHWIYFQFEFGLTLLTHCLQQPQFSLEINIHKTLFLYCVLSIDPPFLFCSEGGLEEEEEELEPLEHGRDREDR